MRLSVGTPKAPLCVNLNLLVIWNRFYVLRFPFVYEGPKGIIVRKTADAATAGSLLASCLQVYQKV
ncbi:hypothetical protein M3Y99_01691100 [Aphelenchoides fujianensis]|nr:hypothetical protein M3Y99_01691100 [Aphelenchoides fujianensis]